MTPQQREAALRMIECGEPSNRLTPDELAAWADDAEGLLRELAQEPQAEQWLWRVYNQGWPDGHEDSTNTWSDWSLISAAYAARLAAGDGGQRYEFTPYKPSKPDATPLRELAVDPVAWIDSNGHPHHLSAVQTVTERRLYGPWKPVFAHPPQRKPLPWQPMRTAPRDGMAVLLLMDGSDIPHAARWMLADDPRGSGTEGWHMTWDGDEISAASCRYWMPIPDDPDEAAHGITEAP